MRSGGHCQRPLIGRQWLFASGQQIGPVGNLLACRVLRDGHQRGIPRLAAAQLASAGAVEDLTARELEKLQVENRGQAIVQALKRGLVALDDLG